MLRAVFFLSDKVLILSEVEGYLSASNNPSTSLRMSA
jgi:hypothetical protein